MRDIILNEKHDNLVEIIEQMLMGDEVYLIKDGKRYAKLTREVILPEKDRVPGGAAHTDHWMADDFDEPLM